MVQEQSQPNFKLSLNTKVTSTITNVLRESFRFVFSSMITAVALILAVVLMADGLKDGAFGIQSITYVTVFQLSFISLGSVVGSIISLYSHRPGEKQKGIINYKASSQAGSIYAFLFGIFLLLLYFSTSHVYNEYANSHFNTLFSKDVGTHWIYASSGLILFSSLKQYWLSILYHSDKKINKILYYVFEFLYFLLGLSLGAIIGLLSNIAYAGVGIGLSIIAILGTLGIYLYLWLTKLYQHDRIDFLKNQFMIILRSTWEYTLISLFTSVIKMFALIGLYYVIQEKVVGSIPQYIQSARIIWYQAMMFFQMGLFGLADYLIYLFNQQKIKDERLHTPTLFVTIIIYGIVLTTILGLIYGFSIHALTRLYSKNQDLVVALERNGPPSYLYDDFRKKLLSNEDTIKNLVNASVLTPEGKKAMLDGIYVRLLTKLNNDVKLTDGQLAMLKTDGFEKTLNHMIENIAKDKLQNDPMVIDLATKGVQLEFLKRVTKTDSLPKEVVDGVNNNHFLDVLHKIIDDIKLKENDKVQQLVYAVQIDTLKKILKLNELPEEMARRVINEPFMELISQVIKDKVNNLIKATPTLDLQVAENMVKKEILQLLYTTNYNDSLLAKFDASINEYVNTWVNKNFRIIAIGEITKQILNKDSIDAEFLDTINKYIKHQVELRKVPEAMKNQAIIAEQTELIKNILNTSTLDKTTSDMINQGKFNDVLISVLNESIKNSEIIQINVKDEVAKVIFEKILGDKSKFPKDLLVRLSKEGFFKLINEVINIKAKEVSDKSNGLFPLNLVIPQIQKELLKGLFNDQYKDSFLKNFPASLENGFNKVVAEQFTKPEVLNLAKGFIGSRVLTALDTNIVNTEFNDLVNRTVKENALHNPLVIEKVVERIELKILDELKLNQSLLENGKEAISKHQFTSFINNELIPNVFVKKTLDTRINEIITSLKSEDVKQRIATTKQIIDPLWMKGDEFFSQTKDKVNPFTKSFKHIEAKDIASELYRNNGIIHIFVFSLFYPLGLIIIRYADIIRRKTLYPIFTLVIQVLAIAFVVGFGIDYSMTDAFKGLYAWNMPLSIIGATILVSSTVIVGINYAKYRIEQKKSLMLDSNN
ncbi:hypothetical protein [Ureaplasma canigenitalium]|uniref:hypothetical protein n=1 Tax=Ureaplasma canigenitalium TaxID=42092 RepID=UPI000570121F|nr:hypothetical protein [Ureaplasma canigenitalium]